MEPPAKRTMAPENQMPKSKPIKMEATMRPMATKPPIFNMPPRKEKSFFVVKATKVRPAKSPRVITPAWPMIFPAYLEAMRRRGRKMIASAMM